MLVYLSFLSLFVNSVLKNSIIYISSLISCGGSKNACNGSLTKPFPDIATGLIESQKLYPPEENLTLALIEKFHFLNESHVAPYKKPGSQITFIEILNDIKVIANDCLEQSSLCFESGKRKTIV